MALYNRCSALVILLVAAASVRAGALCALLPVSGMCRRRWPHARATRHAGEKPPAPPPPTCTNRTTPRPQLSHHHQPSPSAPAARSRRAPPPSRCSPSASPTCRMCRRPPPSASRSPTPTPPPARARRRRRRAAPGACCRSSSCCALVRVCCACVCVLCACCVFLSPGGVLKRATRNTKKHPCPARTLPHTKKQRAHSARVHAQAYAPRRDAADVYRRRQAREPGGRRQHRRRHVYLYERLARRHDQARVRHHQKR